MPVQVTASPLESTMWRPSVLNGPWGQSEEDVLSPLRGRKVISLGWGDKVAALIEVTAKAATQAMDLMAQDIMVIERNDTKPNQNQYQIARNSNHYKCLNAHSGRLHIGGAMRGYHLPSVDEAGNQGGSWYPT